MKAKECKELHFVGAMPLFTTEEDLPELDGPPTPEERDTEMETVAEDDLLKQKAIETKADFVRASAVEQTFSADLAKFPHPGRFEDNIYRMSAREICDALPDYEPKIDNGQLVLEFPLNDESTVVVYTSIKVGQIAGGTGDDSIRVVRRDVTPKGTFWYKDQYLYVTRRVPQGLTAEEAVAHIASKVNKKARHLFRNCPECGALQVKCRAGKGRDVRIWWKGCKHGGL